MFYGNLFETNLPISINTHKKPTFSLTIPTINNFHFPTFFSPTNPKIQSSSIGPKKRQNNRAFSLLPLWSPSAKIGVQSFLFPSNSNSPPPHPSIHGEAINPFGSVPLPSHSKIGRGMCVLRPQHFFQRLYTPVWRHKSANCVNYLKCWERHSN
jgi:hypothetical protein